MGESGMSGRVSPGWRVGVIAVAVAPLDLVVTALPDELDVFSSSGLAAGVEGIALGVVSARGSFGALSADDPDVAVSGHPHLRFVAHGLLRFCHAALLSRYRFHGTAARGTLAMNRTISGRP